MGSLPILALRARTSQNPEIHRSFLIRAAIGLLGVGLASACSGSVSPRSPAAATAGPAVSAVPSPASSRTGRESAPGPLQVAPRGEGAPAAASASRLEDDQPDTGRRAPAEQAPGPHPLAAVTDAELRRMLERDPEALGSMSVGQPNAGRLFAAVQLEASEHVQVVDPSHAYGTRETVEYIRAAIARVHREHAETPPLAVGHISGKNGGHLNPHKSHQTGRDVDLGYYYKDGSTWYARATAASLDVPRTWTLVKALISETDVYFVLMDRSVQVLLREHALAEGEDAAWVRDLFEGTPGERPALIRHVARHATHLHVRFYNPIAEETARRAYPHLVVLGLMAPPTYFVQHRAKKGETLTHLAKRYGTTVREIKRVNGLRSNTILAKRQYKIPKKGPAALGPVRPVPPRRVPPEAAGLRGNELSTPARL